MDLIEISKKLENEGYISSVKESFGFVAGSAIDKNGDPKLGAFFRIQQVDTNYELTYFDRNIPIEKLFNSIDELIFFLKDLYPLED